jgi:hypothetical protein
MGKMSEHMSRYPDHFTRLHWPGNIVQRSKADRIPPVLRHTGYIGGVLPAGIWYRCDIGQWLEEINRSLYKERLSFNSLIEGEKHSAANELINTSPCFIDSVRCTKQHDGGYP